jgi:cellulose synthase/poly-beta-1,6-N-acetylglucosamine synthase-like glycosyltransferase
MDESTTLTVEHDHPAHHLVTASPGSRVVARSDVGRLDVSVIMPTVFWTGTFERCARRVLSLLDETAANAEVIFAFDGVAPPTPTWLDRPGVRIVKTDTRSGPAIARNLAATAARGSILFFIDADVELAADAIDRVHSAFGSDPDLVGLFGAYDDEPVGHSAASVFRNLLHHHTHVSHRGTIGSFWSGCGAIRTEAFLDVGGFDETLAHPTAEDIEFGMRVTDNGGRIVLDPKLRCKQLRQWTLASMVVDDVVHRAKPWAQLIVNSRHMPATLNLDWRARLSGICAVLFVACMMATPFLHAAAGAALACGLALIVMNQGFYRLCLRKRGLGFAVASFAMHTLFLVYSALTFAVVVLQELAFASGRPVSRRCCERIRSSSAMVSG